MNAFDLLLNFHKNFRRFITEKIDSVGTCLPKKKKKKNPFTAHKTYYNTSLSGGRLDALAFWCKNCWKKIAVDRHATTSLEIHFKGKLCACVLFLATQHIVCMRSRRLTTRWYAKNVPAIHRALQIAHRHDLIYRITPEWSPFNLFRD